MKFFNRSLLSLALGLTLVLGACTRYTEDDRKADQTYYDYVSGIETNRANWTTDTSYWTTTSMEYDRMDKDMSTRMERMDEASKKKAEESRAKYAALHADYDKMRADHMAQMEADRMNMDNMNNDTRVYANLGEIGDVDVRFSAAGPKIFGSMALPTTRNITAGNLVNYYEAIVKAARDNGSNYTPAEWDALKAYYEKVDAYKNYLEKNGLSKNDNQKIAGLKIDYNSIRIPGRLDAKASEDPKKNDKNR